MSDIRRWPRMNLALEVTIRLYDVDGAVVARTANISREGLFLSMDPPKALGTLVRIRVALMDTHQAYVLEGVVVRSVPDKDDPTTATLSPGVGVFLTETSAGWAKFVERLQAGATTPDREDGDLVEKVRGVKDIETR